jgi:hypothetical protein
MVYTGAWFSTPAGFGACPELAGYPLWLAAYQESMPMPAPPWDAITIWQYTSSASIAGVATPCDGNLFSGTAAELAGYGAAQRLPEYDWQEPARLQENDWDCSPESMEWCLYAYGRTPDDNWIEESMIAEDVVSVEAGCLDASGAGLAAWLTRHYGPDGYVGSNDPEVSFDAVVEEAGQGLYPVAIGGRAWYHWSGVRGYDDGADLLLLANPAPGWQGVYQTMTRAQFAQLGPFSLVRLRHPAAEGDVETPPLDYSPWAGRIGSGLLEMMAADGVLPAQRYSTWLPLGAPPPADIEECVGTNGITYRWLLTENLGFRIRPS